jgi:hypothetical protein
MPKVKKGGKEITMSFIRFLLQPWIDELLTAARAECFRCFKHHVNCNPRQYSKLLDLRFAAAIYTLPGSRLRHLLLHGI